jgi:hypothetical protein
MEITLKLSNPFFAAALLAATSFAAPVLADRVLSGSEAQNLLAGRQFEFICIDGTHGRANYERGGTASAIYRAANAREDAMEQQDHGRVRPAGEDVCIHWQRLNDGKEGCYRMTERSPGRYRIATADQARWCDLSERNRSKAQVR